MPIRCVCPLGHPLIVPDELAGGDKTCPVCQQRVAIPVADVNARSVPTADKGAVVHSIDRVAGRALPDSTPQEHSSKSAEAVISVVPQFENSATASTPHRHDPPVAAPIWGNQPLGYESRPEQVRAAYIVAIVTGTLAILGTWPVLLALGHPPVAGWVWIVLLLSLVEVAYALWLAILPDWSTLWVGMALCAGLAAFYALALGLVMATPVSRSMPFGLDDVRSSLGAWAACVLVLQGGLSYAAGWISSRWRREYQRWKVSASN